MGLSVPGARQAWKPHRFLPLADTELQSGEALPRQDAERFEGLGEAGGHQHGQSADLRYRHFRTEGRRQMSRENGPSTGQVSEQRRLVQPVENGSLGASVPKLFSFQGNTLTPL